RYRLDDGILTDPGGYRGLPKDRRPRHAGRDLFEQLKPLSAEAVLEPAESGDVAARTRQALDESRADRIDNTHEYNRHRAHLLERSHRSARRGNNDFRRERDKLRRVTAAVSIERAPANVDPRVASECPSPLL